MELWEVQTEAIKLINNQLLLQQKLDSGQPLHKVQWINRLGLDTEETVAAEIFFKYPLDDGKEIRGGLFFSAIKDNWSAKQIAEFDKMCLWAVAESIKEDTELNCLDCYSVNLSCEFVREMEDKVGILCRFDRDKVILELNEDTSDKQESFENDINILKVLSTDLTCDGKVPSFALDDLPKTNYNQFILTSELIGIKWHKIDYKHFQDSYKQNQNALAKQLCQQLKLLKNDSESKLIVEGIEKFDQYSRKEVIAFLRKIIKKEKKDIYIQGFGVNRIEPLKELCTHHVSFPVPSKSNTIDRFFRDLCCEYLRERINYLNVELDNRMDNKEYYVEPLILQDQKPIYDKKKDEFFRSETSRYVISSKSGHGKTIFLQKYFIRNAEKFIVDKEHIFPFYFHLNELRGINRENFVGFLIDKMLFGSGVQGKGIDETEFREIVKAKLGDGNGKILFLLDGFDQTEFEDIRDLFDLSGPGVFQRSKVIIASRPNAFQDNKLYLQEYKELEIVPFSPRQITDYLKNVLKVNGKVDNNKIKKLLQDYFEILKIPILMHLLGDIAKKGGLKKIDNKSDVYAEFCEEIIADGLKKLKDKLHLNNDSLPSAETFQEQLEQISFIGLFHGEKFHLEKDFIKDKIFKEEKIFGNVDDSIKWKYMYTLCKFGIVYKILDSGNKFLNYKHQSFQAYLAACQLVREIKLKPNKLHDLLRKKTGEEWLEVYRFFVELSNVEEKDKLLIARKFFGFYLDNKSNKEMLYDAAKAFSCLKEKDIELGNKIKKELLENVEIDIGEVVEENEKPFQALRDLGEIKFLAEYAANQKRYNSVNRFYAFKYAFYTKKPKHFDVEKVLKEKLINPEDTAKFDILFVLNRTDSELAKEITVKFLRKVIHEVLPGTSKFLEFYTKFYKWENADFAYKQWVNQLREKTKYAPFYVQGNPLYGFRDNLNIALQAGAYSYEWILYRHIYKKMDDKPWSEYEDICMLLLGSTANEKLVSKFFKDFLLDKKKTTDVGLYKQSVVATTLAGCFPWGRSENQEEMVEKVTKRCIDIFEGNIDKSDFSDNNLVSKLLKEKIIKNSEYNPDRICFDYSIEDENQLRERLCQMGINNIKEVLNIWRQFLKKGNKNPYRYYIAGALATIGNQEVINYFFDFIQRPEEKQRWFATMVLGCLKNEDMLKKLEELSKYKDIDDKTKYFINQALLIYSQTHIGSD